MLYLLKFHSLFESKKNIFGSGIFSCLGMIITPCVFVINFLIFSPTICSANIPRFLFRDFYATRCMQAIFMSSHSKFCLNFKICSKFCHKIVHSSICEINKYNGKGLGKLYTVELCSNPWDAREDSQKLSQRKNHAEDVTRKEGGRFPRKSIGHIK